MGLHLLAMLQLVAYFVEKFENKTTERFRFCSSLKNIRATFILVKSLKGNSISRKTRKKQYEENERVQPTVQCNSSVKHCFLPFNLMNGFVILFDRL